MEETKKTGFGTASLVLGIIGICTSFIPIINNLSFIMGILSIIFGVIALIKKDKKVKVVISIVIGILAIVITINSQKALSDSLNVVSSELDKATGNRTEEILKNEADITLGEFQVDNKEYFTSTKLVVTVKNKTNEAKTFSIQIEAVDESGNRLRNDYVYANNLSAGQSQNFDTFTLITSDEIESMQNATYRIVEVSSF